MTTDVDRNKIIMQVKKLSELANPENGGYENEVSVAAAKMQQLMDKYNISLLEVMQADEISPSSILFEQLEATIFLPRLAPWHWKLARAIGYITSTKHYSTSKFGNFERHQGWGSTFCFFGNIESCRTATFLFDKWVVEFNQMATQATSQYCKEKCAEYGAKNAYRINYRYQAEHPNAFRNSWLIGCANAVATAAYDQTKKRDTATSQALMVIENKLVAAYKEHSKEFRTVNTSGSGNMNPEGYMKGMSTGNSLSLNPKSLGNKNLLGG